MALDNGLVPVSEQRASGLLLPMSSYAYAEAPNSNLICCICRMPFVKPVTARTCTHTFCRECIRQALLHSSHCPVDRSPLSDGDLAPANPIVQSLVDELLIECPNRSTGCMETFQRQLVDSHLRDACLSVEICCPEEGCDQAILRKDIGKHSHDCLHRLIECDACQMEVKFIDIEDHLTRCPVTVIACNSCSLEVPRTEIKLHVSICPEVSVACPHNNNGCPWQGPRRSLDSSHIPSCPFAAIKGFFIANDKRMSVLTEENMFLKQKVHSLEGLLQTLQREMQCVKAALGPWFRPDGVQPHLTHQSSADALADFQPRTPSTSRYPYDHSASTSSGVLSPPVSAVPDVLATYFPLESEERFWPAPPADPSRRMVHRPSMSVPELPDTVSMYSMYSRPALSTIAPVNLSSTLESALEGLRDSVVALATSVDSHTRRNDIAVTNETLRMNEEIMSLRANVHGLRMQVHAIMMDRNAQVTGRTGDQLVDGWPGLPPTRVHFNQALAQPPASITKL